MTARRRRQKSSRRGRWLVLLLVLAAAAGWAIWGGGPADKAPAITDLAKDAAVVTLRDPASLSAKAIPPDDLPPAGTRSLFDHLIREANGLPYPFEKLVEQLATYDREGRKPLQLLIPLGRSLLKADAHFEDPRIVVAGDMRPADSDNALAPQFRGHLFLGFTERAEEIEVISYNEQAGRFEFQLVKDYAPGKNPVITYARRNFCTPCHQGEAPIFPVRPWQETNGQPAIIARIAEARGIAETDLAKASFHGTPLVTKLLTPETIDDLTNIGNVIPATQQAWIDGCGGGDAGLACRRQMLKLAVKYLVDPGAYAADKDGRARLLDAQKAAWPARGIPLMNPDIPNRDPLTEEGTRFDPIGWIKGLLPAGGGGSGEGEVSAKIAAFAKLPPLKRDLDPLTPRTPYKIISPSDDDGIIGIAQLFTANDRRLIERQAGYELARIEAAIDGAALTPLLAPAPFRRVPAVQAILKELGHASPPAGCCEDTSAMSPPHTEGVKPLKIADGSVLRQFETYCFACHRGNPAAQLDFMSGDNEETVLARIKETAPIRDRLDFERFLGTDKEGQLMPPAASPQRLALDEARKAGKKDLDAMRDTVPGLFD